MLGQEIFWADDILCIWNSIFWCWAKKYFWADDILMWWWIFLKIKCIILLSDKGIALVKWVNSPRRMIIISKSAFLSTRKNSPNLSGNYIGGSNKSWQFNGTSYKCQNSKLIQLVNTYVALKKKELRPKSQKNSYEILW